uniref:Uncharacterized protein n=1 Tax=Arundo donax TaxID=35708 RepID=A0A0A9HTX9_ARUDO
MICLFGVLFLSCLCFSFLPLDVMSRVQ